VKFVYEWTVVPTKSNASVWDLERREIVNSIKRRLIHLSKWKQYHDFLLFHVNWRKCRRGVTGWPWNIINIFFNLRTAAFKAYCAIWIRRSNFRHRASPRLSPCESTQRRKVELWARNVREFCLNADLHVTFRDILSTVMLRHGTDGFTSLPKEVVLRIFSP